MRKIVLMAIVLVMIAVISPFSAVSAGKPEYEPPEGPVSDITTLVVTINETVAEIRDMVNGISGSMNTDIETLQVSMDDNFTDVDSSLEEIESDLYDFRMEVGDNFTDVKDSLDSIQENVSLCIPDPNAVKMITGGGAYEIEGVTPYQGLSLVDSSEPFKVTITIVVGSFGGGESVNVGYFVGEPNGDDYGTSFTILPTGYAVVQTYEFVCSDLRIHLYDINNDGVKIWWNYVITYSGEEPHVYR
jgi:hypothetical protein